jgi:hypothetical protein
MKGLIVLGIVIAAISGGFGEELLTQNSSTE